MTDYEKKKAECARQVFEGCMRELRKTNPEMPRVKRKIAARAATMEAMKTYPPEVRGAVVRCPDCGRVSEGGKYHEQQCTAT